MGIEEEYNDKELEKRIKKQFSELVSSGVGWNPEYYADICSYSFELIPCYEELKKRGYKVELKVRRE